jgi:NTP pyrophosphatase (non-canonical NTP hydrolase)
MSQFLEGFIEKQQQVHSTALEKGWWDTERNDAEMICLMHSELSEALEALRHGNPPDDKVPEFTGLEAELADCIIRIMDYAEGRNLRVAEALEAKTDFNKTRPYKHGKNF